VIINLVKNLTRKTQWDKTMVKGKKCRAHDKDNYIQDEECQLIFCTSYSKTLLGGDFLEIFGLSPYSSAN
jgi:hypothetical protein